MSDILSFGDFELVTSERLLRRQGVPVELGARAFDVLATLVARPNEVVGKRDLLDQVWPAVTVEEGSLRFHVAKLRKALGDGRNGARYIATLTGQGYCFVAPVTRSAPPDDRPAVPEAGFPQANLPSRLSRMVGRDHDLARLAARLAATRFVTLVGTGGVGKTTLAVALGHELAERFAGAVQFVDLGALADPELVAGTVAATLGLTPPSDDATAGLLAHLADRRVLLILDTCEHVVDRAAELAARIFAMAPEVAILATSREPLQVEGEQVHRLAPLACPPDRPDLATADATGFPAARLFVERARASGAELALDDAGAAVVGRICRRLDGVPLAIELAASRVGSYGLAKTAELLDARLTLSWRGQRTAPPRQRTLQATLDWSYGLLSGFERLLLRRLAVFVGQFSIEAVRGVATGDPADEAAVFGAIDSLIAKSMVATRPIGASMYYRLLDTTRDYALQLAIEPAERRALAARHAGHHLRWLAETGAEWPSLSSPVQRSLHLAALANVRAALAWCFGRDGDPGLGIRLAAAAAPVFLSMSLLVECHRWTAQALDVLDDTTRGSREEMQLQAALGVALMFTRGGQDPARTALQRSFAIAERQGDAQDQLRVLGPLQMFCLRTGEFRTALGHAERCAAIARTLEDSVSTTLAHALMGISLHLDGAHDRARAALEAALRHGPRSDRTTTGYLGFDGRILAGAILARTLWLEGRADEARSRAERTVAEAETLDQPLTLSIALVWAASTFLWSGELARAAELVERLSSQAASHSLSPYLAVGRGFAGELAIRRGDAATGVEHLRQALAEPHAAPYELLTTHLDMALVQGLAAAGRPDEAAALVEATLRSVEAKGDHCYLPELLRLKGRLVADAAETEALLLRSLELARRQGARAWQRRTAADLANLLVTRGEHRRAQEFLRSSVGCLDDPAIDAGRH